MPSNNRGADGSLLRLTDRENSAPSATQAVITLLGAERRVRRAPPARRRRGARGLRAAAVGWPPAGCAGASSPSSTTSPAKATPGYHCTGTGHAGRGQRRPPPACRRRRDRRRGRGGVPGRAATGGAARATWPPPSSSRTATTPRWRSGAARSNRPATRASQSPAPLPRRRPGQPPGRPRPGDRVEHCLQTLADAEAELRNPRSGRDRKPLPHREISDPGTR